MRKPSGKSGGIEKGNSIIAHLDSLSHRARLAVSLASVCLYLVLFFFLYPMTGSGTDVTAVLPVVVIGWLWGSRAGTTTGLLGLLVNTLLFSLVGEQPGGWDVFIRSGGGIGSIVLVLTGAAVGLLHDLREQLKWEFGERKKREIELQIKAQHLAALSDMGRTVLASLDLENVLSEVADRVLTILNGAEGVSILLREDQSLVFAAVSGSGANVLRGQRISADAGVAGLVLRTGKPTRISSPSDQAMIYREIEQVSGYHTQALLAAPLKWGNEILGVIEAVHTDPEAFDDNDLQLIESAAGWSSIAIGNARQHAEIQRRLKESQAVAAITRALTETLDSDRVFQWIVLSAQQIIPRVERAVIHLIDEGDSSLRPVAVVGPVGRESTSLRMRPGEGIAGQVLANGETINIGDVRTDTRYISRGPEDKMRSILVAPIQRGTLRFGTISIQSTTLNAFHADDERLLTQLGVQAAIAIENTRLFTDLQNALRQEQATRAQLVQADKLSAMGRMAASIAHEINNPLQAIQGCLDLAQTHAKDAAKQQRYLVTAKAEVERLTIIVQRMLDFYRPAKGTRMPIDARAVLEEVIALSSKRLQHSNTAVQTEWETDAPVFHGIGNQLKQVFLNLVLNATEAMPTGGNLRICGRNIDLDGQKWLTIAFTDSGQGIPRNDLDKIFEPFYTTKSTGTGLGLAVSHNIITNLGGRLTAESVIGRGSTFTVWLPISPSSLVASR